MHCGRIWAFDENLERRTDHGSAKSAFAVRPSLADITSLPSCLANYRSLGATEASTATAMPASRRGVHVCNSQCTDRGSKSI
jgi:hypothetical protein